MNRIIYLFLLFIALTGLSSPIWCANKDGDTLVYCADTNAVVHYHDRRDAVSACAAATDSIAFLKNNGLQFSSLATVSDSSGDY